ncbi:MAG: hypothetical protein ACXW29_04875, partial [Thermoanaerobaculia bacterium]
ALGRFDESVTIGTHVDDRSAMTGEPTAIVLLASDHPALSATAAPESGSDLIRASNVVVTWTASSIAGLANATTLLSAAPPARVDLFPAYPPTLTAQTTTIAVPATAPLGPATLTLRLTDRADRFTDAPVVTYTVVDNQPPAISAFTLNPESVYPGHSVTATVNASDDLAVTKLTLTTQIGASAPIVDARTPNAKTTEQTFTVPIPISTPGLTPVSVEAAVEDNFPGRAALKQTRSISVLKDTLPPQLTLTRPALDELFDEGTGKFVEYRAAASDAEVDVKSVTVTVGDAAPVPLTKDATGWTVTLPVPNVDGTDIVAVPFTMTASDYESNTKTLPSRIRVRPLIDPNAPAVTWTCGSSGAMYPVGFAAKLGLLAVGSSPTNGVQKVEFFVDGSTTPISATRVGTTNQWEASYTIPDRPDGTVITIRGVATSVGGNPADLASKITVIVPSLAPITADLTIDSANAATYANKIVVVQSGTVTIATPLTLDRLALLGGKLTHRAGGTEKLAVTTTRDLFVSCDASIDVTGAGFAQNETYPGATRPGSGSAGSHIGVGAVANPPAASTFGSVYQPQEGGGGGEHPNIDNGQPGGGVVRLIASTVTNEGVIRANGRDRTCCFDVRGGAGGSIWVTANGIGGRGAAEVIGGSTYNTPTGGGGAISIESVTTPVLWQMSARAGFTASGTVRFGGAGTIYVRDTASTFGSVTIDNGGRPSEAADLPSLGHGTAQSGTTGATLATDRAAIPVYFAGHWVEITSAAGTLKGTWRIASVSGTTATLEPNATETIALMPGDLWQGVYRFDTLFAPNGDAIRSVDPIRLGANGVLNLTGPTGAGRFLDLPSGVSADTVTVSGNVSLPSITAANVTLKTGAVLSPPKRNNDPQPLIIASTDTMTIETGAALDATGRGFGGSLTWPGATLPGLATAGSHIGIGGISILPAASTFGSVYRPMEAGGGGEQANPDAGQPGGGVIRLSAATITNNGAIRANGMDRTCCFGVRGGGGGSIWVSGTTAVRGNGTAEAVGSATYDGPTGGGGAISIESGSADPILWTMSARAGSPVGGSKIGGAGTIYVRRATSTYGEVTIDNGGRTGQLTDLPSLGSGIAQANTTGATLVTDRATIPAYFAGHWIEIASGGAPKGTWRIATIAGSTITLAPNASESIALAPGDLWQGVYRFDTMFSPNGDPLRSADPIRLGANGVIDISGPTAAGKFLNLPSGLAADQVTLRGNVSVPSIDAANVTVKSGATLAPTRDTSNPRPLIISATGVITVESGGAIDATGRGFGGSLTYPGATLPGSVSAGSHLGVGGVGNPPAASTFGSVYRPLEAGGGGEHPNPDAGQAGGGVIHLTAANIINDGAIRANGADRTCCFGVRGGAGGSIWIASPALGGTGVVEARGSDTYDGPTGGGGAVSIESAGTSVLPWPVNANPGSYAGGYGATGGPGTIYVKRAGATYGDVDISNPYAFADQLTDLPSLGAGIAQSGTAGATLLTGRSTDIPPYFAGHWVEIKTAAGALKGVWRIASIAGRNATLAPNGAETIALEVGDAWRGAYRLDSLRLRSAKLITADRLIVTAPPDLDPSSSILGNNDGAPVVNAAQISITASAVGAAVIGRAGAALDQDKPITVIVTNVASGATYSALVANDGSFSAAVSGNSGDRLTVKARDGNYFPLESAPIDIGTLTTGAPTATQFDRAAWTTDPAFSAQLLAMNGTTLVVSSANLNGASSDKLAVLDTTDPLHPALVRTIPTTINHIRDLEVAGGWAYIAGDRFATIDLGFNGATPNFASGENYGERQAIAVQGGYAFTADANYLDGRLNVYDVTDPAAPRLMG